MNDPNRPPLWQVMRTAYDCSTAPNGSTDDWTERDGFAAEIRAIAEWIKKARPDSDEILHGAIRADELDSILALLTAEADRAERGD